MKDQKSKQSIYYEIRTEALVPTLITYRIKAESPEEALKLFHKSNPTKVIPQLLRKRNLKATIYEAGKSIIKLTKYFQ